MTLKTIQIGPAALPAGHRLAGPPCPLSPWLANAAALGSENSLSAPFHEQERPAFPVASGSEFGFSLHLGKERFDFHLLGTSQTPVNIA